MAAPLAQCCEVEIERDVPLWKITPVASIDDPRWQDRTIWTEVIVEAPTAAFARRFAAKWASPEELRVGNESPSPVSGFEDEKLYWVRRLPDDLARQLRLNANDAGPVLRALKQGERGEEAFIAERPIRH